LIKIKLLSVFCGICIWMIFSCGDKSISSKPPSAPSNLTGHALSSSSIIIYWADNSNNETSFLIFRSHNSDWAQIAIAAANQVSFVDSMLQDSSIYSYRIIAKNEAGQSSPSDTFALTTLSIGSPPNMPYNPSPYNDSIGVSIYTELGWSDSDPDGDTLRYALYLGVGSYLTCVDSSLVDAHYSPGRLQYETRYNWRVVAQDNHRHITYGPIWHFTTKPNAHPDAPNNPIPADNAQDIDRNVILSWECGDIDGDTLVYDVYFGQGTNPSLVMTNLPQMVFDPGALRYSEQYSWKITVRDTYNNETRGPVWSFQTRDSSYSLTVLLQGMGDVIISPEHQNYNYGDTIILSAIANSGWYFSGWTGDTTESVNPLSVIIRRNMNIVANFSEGIPPTSIRGVITWPGHALSNHTYAFADSVSRDILYLVAQANVNPSTGQYTITINNLSSAINLRFEAQDDVNNSGAWHNIDSGDGWGFYDGNQDSLWNDVIQISPGDHLTGINMVLHLTTLRKR
jgi:hypothetical protein